MTHHDHDHQGHSHPHGEPQPKRGLHRDWRVWVIVLLMLAAMLVYIFSLDEALWPGAPPQPQNPVPAAPAQ